MIIIIIIIILFISVALEISYDDGIQCVCRNGLPPAVESATNLIHVYFESRGTLSAINQGFSLKWRQIPRQHIPTLPTTTTPPATTVNNVSSVSNNFSTEKSLFKSLDDAYSLEAFNFNDTYYQLDEVTTPSEVTKGKYTNRFHFNFLTYPSNFFAWLPLILLLCLKNPHFPL